MNVSTVDCDYTITWTATPVVELTGVTESFDSNTKFTYTKRFDIPGTYSLTFVASNKVSTFQIDRTYTIFERLEGQFLL